MTVIGKKWHNLSYSNCTVEFVMTSVNISLPEVLKDYVEEQVVSGGYGTVSEYIRDLIRQDQQRKAQQRLETLLLESLNSEPATAMTADDWADIRNTVRAKIVKRIGQDSIHGKGE
jgi:antitoxin ParD1/3/4